MTEARVETVHRVTALELFFDLVFVFAFTQVTGFISADPTWGGLLRGLLVLAALWWAWSGYAWLTNVLDPEEGGIRFAVLGAIGALLIAALAVPGAFGADGVLFGLVYLFVRVVQIGLYAKAFRNDPEWRRTIVTLIPGATVAPGLLIVAGLVAEPAKFLLWAGALAILYGVPLLGLGGFRLAPEHFVERYGLVVIIALGESIVSIGVGAAGLPLTLDVILAALLGVTVAACVWWSYFDWVIYVSRAWLTEATGAERTALGRDLYSYLHLPMVAGIVLFALGLKATLHDIADPLPTIPAVGLCGGLAVYFIAHVLMRLRLGGGLGRGRPVATVVLVVLIPVATMVPALLALAAVAAVCTSLIAYEALRHRYERAWIRERRGEFTRAEAEQLGRLRRDSAR
jgi:low temperature requirement protein LtrA